jgi:hypothetical protein
MTGFAAGSVLWKVAGTALGVGWLKIHWIGRFRETFPV